MGPILLISGVTGNIMGALVSSSMSRNCIKNKSNGLKLISKQTTDQSSKTDSPNLSIVTKWSLKNIAKVLPQRISDAFRKRQSRFNINQYLLKWFFLINLFNVVYVLLIRLIDVSEAQRVLKSQDRFGKDSVTSSWIAGYGWNYYMANYHFPTSKPFITLGFLIYVLFFMNQMVAINYPFTYKEILTKNRLRLAIIICTLYSFLWYLPTFKWFDIVKIYICNDGALSNTSLNASNSSSNSYTYMEYRQIEHYPIYNYVIERTQTPPIKQLWIFYQIMRELSTKVLPFFAMMLFKVLILRKTNTRQAEQQNIGESMTDCSSIVNPSNYQAGKGNVLVKFIKKINKIYPRDNLRETSVSGVNVSQNNPDRTIINSSTVPRYLQRLSEERKQHKKTMFILTLEFIFLLLPMSISQMMMDILSIRYHSRDLIIFYNICSLFEFVYISCTFYINFAFNPIYRSYVYGRLRTF
ncbi:unnamed protein product [Gordionus sp. m RMFG-2023]